MSRISATPHLRGGGVVINRDDGVAIKFRHSHQKRGAVVEALQCFLALFQGRFGFLASAPHGQMRADAREQLACREGLDEVVVGPAGQALYAALFARSCRQKDNRNGTRTGILAKRLTSSKPLICGIMTSLKIRRGGSASAACALRRHSRRRLPGNGR